MTTILSRRLRFIVAGALSLALLMILIPNIVSLRRIAEPCGSLDMWRQWSGCFQSFTIDNLGIDALAVAPDNQRIAMSGRNRDDQNVLHMVTTTGAPLWSITTEQWITSLRFSPDGKLLAGVGHEAETIIWNTQTGAQEQILDTDSPFISFSLDSQLLFANGKLWRIADGTVFATVDANDVQKQDVPLPGWGVFEAQSPDRQWIAESPNTNTSVDQTVIQLRHIVDGAVTSLQPPFMRGGGPLYIYFSSNSESVMGEYQSYGGAEEGGNVWIWRVSDGSLQYRLHLRERFSTIAWAPDSTIIAIPRESGYYQSEVQLYKVKL